MEDNELPTVATIIGCPEQLTGTNGLVATPIGLPGSLGENGGDDAIQKALIGNLCPGFLPKKEREMVHCNICDVSCTGELAYKSHVAGARHAKKVKEKEADIDIATKPFITEDPTTKTFECTLCNVKLNARNQIAAHVAGAKHKVRLAPNEKIYSAAPRQMPYHADMSANLLYCATCGVHANSALQMEQHMRSAKHINKVNGNSAQTIRRPMGPPRVSSMGPPRGSSMGPPRGSSMGPPRGSSMGPSRASLIGPTRAPPMGPTRAPPMGPTRAPPMGPSRVPPMGPSPVAQSARYAPYPSKGREAFLDHICNRREPIRNRNFDEPRGGGDWAPQRFPNNRFLGEGRGGYNNNNNNMNNYFPNQQRYNGRPAMPCARHGPAGYSY